MTENITATITYDIRHNTEDGGANIASLDAVLTTLRKHGVHPTYFEYDEERDSPAAETSTTREDIVSEHRTTEYDSTTDTTTFRLEQVIKGELRQ